MSYYPGTYDGGPIDLYVQEELQRIAEELTPLEDGAMQQRHVAPDKPRDGLFYADGTDWDPGSGQGLYVYDEITDGFIFVGGAVDNFDMPNDVALRGENNAGGTFHDLIKLNTADWVEIGDPSRNVQFDGAEIQIHGPTYVRSGNAFRVYGPANTDTLELSHDGTNASIASNNTNIRLDVPTAFNFQVREGTVRKFAVQCADSQVEVRDGYALCIYDPTDTDWAQTQHDGTSLYHTFFGTQYVRTDISGTTGGWALTDGSAFKFWMDTASSQFDIRDGYKLRIRDAADTDYIDIYDSGIEVVLEPNTNPVVWKLPTDGSWTVAEGGTHKFNIIHSDDTVRVRDGYEFRVYDTTDADYVFIEHEGNVGTIGTNANNLKFAPVTGLAYVYTSGTNGEFRIYDADASHYLRMRHDGTDAILSHSGGSQILCNAQFRANLSGSFGGNLHNFSAYGSQPIYELYETGQSSNEARWAIRTQASTFSVSVVNDTGSTGLTDAFTIKRTGTTVDEIDFLSTDLFHNGNPIGIEMYSGYCTNTGTPTLTGPSGWTNASGGTGRTTITHNLGTTAYHVVATPRNSGGTLYASKIESVASNTFRVAVLSSGGYQNVGFEFVLMVGVE